MPSQFKGNDILDKSPVAVLAAGDSFCPHIGREALGMERSLSTNSY